MGDRFLFDPELLEKFDHLGVIVPRNLYLRPLSLSDYSRDVKSCLGQLTSVEGLSKEAFERAFVNMEEAPGHYYIVVVVNRADDKIAAMGTLFLEQKLIRGASVAGHIEDIVVSSDYRGGGYGRMIISALQYLAKKLGCYKIILDCGEHNVAFYEKCGLKRKEVQMVQYLSEVKSKL